MKPTLRLLLLAGSLITFPAMALEGETIGSVTATIDGTGYTGETLAFPSEGSAMATFVPVGPSVTVSVQAMDPQAESRLNNMLVIDFTALGTDATAQMITGSISWWPEGMDSPFYISDENAGHAGITLDSLSLDGEARVTGSFDTSICRKDGPFSEADTSKCVKVSGRFDTALHAQ
ncbi:MULTISPECIES: hypothetical protein [Nitratireductor]|uniref:hypothetical protein n=1 Tax=Nitratireductor TaxID=245876 RepID=UPI0019D3F988|nr:MULTISPECIES: hypothetical protein [Nitratireductor]MBN7778354.1 hypothetical protein [Nitratireductor pacificus]MBN7782676.1 hypothetical protein [Nitratireductor pacificus]MBN7791483.1 hypothetical protein [Nitratireductor aquimarinus]MBY6100741.1 hypothetical protein [Nitratireductor aquimarinus]MCA1261459.1 hypothetical protein [Nitratireductor aquimarinus]